MQSILLPWLSNSNNQSVLTAYNFGNSLAKMKLGDRVKDRRQELGYSQAKLAELAGITQPAIVKIEHGADTVHTFALARALGVRPEWLYSGEGEKDELLNTDGQPSIPSHLSDPESRGLQDAAIAHRAGQASNAGDYPGRELLPVPLELVSLVNDLIDAWASNTIKKQMIHAWRNMVRLQSGHEAVAEEVDAPGPGMPAASSFIAGLKKNRPSN